MGRQDEVRGHFLSSTENLLFFVEKVSTRYSLDSIWGNLFLRLQLSFSSLAEGHAQCQGGTSENTVRHPGLVQSCGSPCRMTGLPANPTDREDQSDEDDHRNHEPFPNLIHHLSLSFLNTPG